MPCSRQSCCQNWLPTEVFGQPSCTEKRVCDWFRPVWRASSEGMYVPLLPHCPAWMVMISLTYVSCTRPLIGLCMSYLGMLSFVADVSRPTRPFPA